LKTFPFRPFPTESFVFYGDVVSEARGLCHSATVGGGAPQSPRAHVSDPSPMTKPLAVGAATLELIRAERPSDEDFLTHSVSQWHPREVPVTHTHITTTATTTTPNNFLLSSILSAGGRGLGVWGWLEQLAQCRATNPHSCRRPQKHGMFQLDSAVSAYPGSTPRRANLPLLSLCVYPILKRRTVQRLLRLKAALSIALYPKSMEY